MRSLSIEARSSEELVLDIWGRDFDRVRDASLKSLMYCIARERVPRGSQLSCASLVGRTSMADERNCWLRGLVFSGEGGGHQPG